MVEPVSLAAFLRTRREELSPEDVGLRPTGRRRTPGLRREEVATLAGVSIDYLIRLEQGRDVNPSPEVVVALAEALRLDREGTRRLLSLVMRTSSPHLRELCPEVPRLDAEVPRTVRLLLDGLDPLPAFVVGPIGDVVTSNEAWRTVAEPIGLLAVGNLARHAFGGPDDRAAYLDWELVAEAEAGRLREVHDGLRQLPRYQELVAELGADPAFEQRYGRCVAPVARRRRLGLALPSGPVLHLDVEALDLDDPGRSLVTWVPADEATEARLRDLRADPSAAGSGHLRVVGDGAPA